MDRLRPEALRAPAVQLERLKKILATGTRLFEERGYGRTTMDEIAEEAGITKRTLYRYVRTKQDFLLMIHEQFLDATEQLLLEDVSTSNLERFKKFVQTYCTVITRHHKAVRVFFEEEHNLSAEARDQVVARRDGFERRLWRLLRDGQQSGEFRQFDIPVVSSGIFGALAGTYQWFSPRGPMSVEELAETLGNLLTTGLVKPHGEAPTPYRGLQLDVPEVPDEKRPNSIPKDVLAAAVQLFATQGYTETSTREIAGLAQVTKSILFYHIGTKEQLLFAIHHDFGINTLKNLAETLAAPADSFEEALRRIVIMHVDMIGSQTDHVRVFSDQRRYLAPTRRAEVERLRSRYVEGLVALLDAGRDAGSFRPYDSRIVALAALSMLNWMSRWYDPQGRLEAARIGEEYAGLLVSGIAAG